MPAKAMQISITEEDLKSAAGGAYAEIEVPGDYEVTLSKVEDYDNTGKGGSYGWIFHYDVDTPSGGVVPFRTWLAFSQAARWKLIEVLTAHDVDLDEGLNQVDPNMLVGEVVGCTIDFPRDKETGEPTSEFRELQSFWSLADEPDAEIPADAEDLVPDAVEVI